jgi:ABC-type branched-subunit amino acid transport system permease subunit
MTTIIEKDSPTSTLLMIFVVIILLIGGAGLVFGYMNGTFGINTTVIDNNRTIKNKTVVLSSQLHTPVSEKRDQIPVR